MTPLYHPRPERWPHMEAWVAIFFATGVAIALPVSLSLQNDRAPAFVAIAVGAAMGGYGAWFVFAIGIRLRASFSKITARFF